MVNTRGIIQRLAEYRLTLRRHLDPPALILIYHRVTELSSDPWSLAITPAHLAEQLRTIRAFADPLPLQRLWQLASERRLPPRAVAVTFDDGYADNLLYAKPILERFEVPATFFVSTDYLEQQREFWWDELEDLALYRPLPQTMVLSAGGRAVEYVCGDGPVSESTGASWKVTRADDLSPRHALFRSFWDQAHRMCDTDREELLRELRQAAGVERTTRTSHRPMTEKELLELAHTDLIDIGGHTASHPALAGLPSCQQADEISQGKERLEEILGRPVKSFAYPIGRRMDYTDETVALVRQAGFTLACVNIPGVVERDTDPFRLPRIRVQDASADELEKLLQWWFTKGE